MFAADLSWTDQNDEKVGERRARKAKQREGSIQSASTDASTDRKKSASRSESISASIDGRNGSPSTVRRTSCWSRPSFGSNKDDTKQGKKKSIEERSETSNGQVQSRIFSLPFGDVSPQPGWTISTKLPATLPSGGSIEPDSLPQSSKSPTTAFDSQSRCTSPTSLPSIASPGSNSPAGQVTVETSLQRIDEVIKPRTPRRLPGIESLRNLTSVLQNEVDPSNREEAAVALALEQAPSIRPSVPPKDDIQPPSEKTLPSLGDLPGSFQGLDTGSLGTTTTIWSDARPGRPTRRPSVLRHRRSESGRSGQSPAPDGLPNRKDSSDGHSRGPVKETHGDSPSTSSSSTADWCGPQWSSPLPLTHSQLERAGPRLVYDHLREEWKEPEDDTTKAEIAVERRLWVLTALHLRNLAEKFLISGEPGLPNKAIAVHNVLELDGNIAEVFQLSALYPEASVLYLSTEPIPNIEMPSQISCSTISPSEFPRLPYPSSSLNLVRGSNLPSLLPSAQIPALLAECYRVLSPGGSLELRFLDPLPDRKTSGPLLRAWIEVRLLLNLEMSFRCTRPSLLVPQWIQAAGFSLQASRSWSASRGKSVLSTTRSRSMSEAPSLARIMQVPAANDDQGVVGAYVDDEVGVMVGRELWKGVWGDFVTERKGEEKWWWENEGCLKEAIERDTKWSIFTLLAVKPEQS